MVWELLINVRKGSAFVAEPSGALMGLHLAWKLGTMQLILEIDNQSLVGAIKEKVGRQEYWNLIRLIKYFMTLDWKVEVCYTSREDNRCVDYLARLATERPWEST